MGTKYSTILVGGVVQTYNDAPPADDGSQTEANRVKFVTVTGDLTAPLHSAITNMDGKIAAHVDEGPTAKSSAYTTIAADHNSVIECTGTFPLSLLNPSGNTGYHVTIKNAGSGTITVDVDGGANVDGAASVSLGAGLARKFYVNAAGTAYYSVSGSLSSGADDKLDQITTTRGDIIRGDTSGNEERLALGSSGQVLTSDGTDAGWANPKVEVIEQGTVSAAAELDLINLSTDYQMYELVFNDLSPATDNVAGSFRTSTDNGSTFESGADTYAYAIHGVRATDTDERFATNSATGIRVGVSNFGNGANEVASGVIRIHNPAAAGTYTQITYEITFFSSGSVYTVCQGGGIRKAAQANDAIRLLFASGNIATMNYTLYGYRKS